MIQFCAKGTLYFLRIIALCAIWLPSSRILAAPERLTALATTSIIGDTARQIAGPNIEVEALMGPGIDPHLYKASPGDLRKLSSASLVLYNGLHLEGKMADLLEKLGRRKQVIAVAGAIPVERLRRTTQESDNFDPHIWFDVALWIEAARAIRDAFSSLDPANSAAYTERFSTLASELTTLDAWCRQEFSTIPIDRRVLITAHDAFGYMGRAYGIEVLGIQGVSTDSEASLREINTLVTTITTRGVPAVFIESTVSPKTVQALLEGARARNHHVALGGELFSDALGAAGSSADSYQSMVRHNVTTITRALRGERR